MNKITVVFENGNIETMEYFYQYTDRKQLTIIDKNTMKHHYDIQDVKEVRVKVF